MPPLKPTRGIFLNKSHPLARGLAGCWLMNEGAGSKICDLSGGRKNGTLTNVIWKASKHGLGLDFNGTDAYGVLPTSNQILTDDNNWSISISFCPDSLAVGRLITLHRGASAGSAFYIGMTSNDRIVMYFYDASMVWKGNAIKYVSVGDWSCVFLSYDGSQFKWYYNGKYVDAATETFIGFGSYEADLGSYDRGTSEKFNGTLDHIVAFNRCLSASEIALLYREPFCMFERAIRPVLISGQIINLAGTSTALSSLNATAKAIRKVVGTVAGKSDVAALLNLIRGEESSLDIERSWLREALFNGMTANAFKLGTTLSLGWFWVRVAGCSVLYRGPSMQGIDFTSILTVAEQNACDISPPSYIPHNSGSTYFYVIRRFNNCGYQELTLAAAAKVSIDASGDLEKPQPNNIFSSKAEQVNGNKIQLVWFYCPLEQKSQPVCFNVYYNGGMGQIDYENPLAKISYEGRRFYSYQSGALGAGGYLFTIRAEDADGIENSSSAQLKIQLDTTNPDAIDILSTETV